METHARYTRPSLYDQAWCISKFIFGYTFPTFYRGVKNNGLDFEDIHRCPDDDQAEKLIVNLKKNWSNELKSKRPRFWWALLKTFIVSYTIPVFVWLFMECFLRILQPLMLGRVIRYFANDPTVTYEMACWCAGGVILCTALLISIFHPIMLRVMRLGMRVRVACCSLMYLKALRLSRAAVGQTAVGQIINIMSNDVNRWDEFAIFFPFLVVAPVQTGIVIYILYTYISYSCFVGIALLLLFIPFQGWMGGLFSRVRLATANLTDTRLRYMSEIIPGMRVIKMYCWETPFAERVAQTREAEVNKIRRACYLKAINLSLYFVATRIILFGCFVTYVLLDRDQNILKSEAVFVSMALFNTLRWSMTFFFPQAISSGSELKITCQRIEKFLLLEEMTTLKQDGQKATLLNEKSEKLTKQHCNRNNSKPIKLLSAKLSNPVAMVKSEIKGSQANLMVKNISAKWSQDLLRPTLKDISVRLESGDLLAVIGPVGSGKSSFLMSLLKELPLTSGEIDLNGSISYASQDAWSFNDSVRNNILFGLPFDEKRYNEVIRVCALERDLTLMPHGDRTLVGEKGVSLSGGQKARINLARAVYRNADICLLDDPLSAVDTAVAEHIFDKCLLDHLTSKIRILVTHQIQFIQKATKILVLKEGNCLACGTFAELQQMGIDFMSLLEEESSKEGTTDQGEDRDRAFSHRSLESSSSLSDSLGSRLRTVSKTQECFEVLPPPDGDEVIKLEEEKYQKGSIKWQIYKEYVKAGAGPILLIAVTIFTVLSQSIFSGSDIFLTYWTNKNQENADKENQHIDITIYAVLIFSLFVTTVLRSITFFYICTRASKNLHNSIFARLLRAPVAFFDTNPVGRILNRFTKDLGIVDEVLPNTAFDLTLVIAQAIGIVITVAIVNWYLILPAIVLTIFIIYLRAIYIKSARDIRRFEGIARSPVFSHVSTTINGLPSIRAFGEQEAFERQFFTYQNDHTSTWFLFITTNRSIGLILDWVCTIYISSITLAIMLSKESVMGGDAGLAITSGLMLAGDAQWAVRQSAEFESQMTSVERIIEYKNLEKEAPAESMEQSRPPTNWPREGQIEFNQMCLAYGKNTDNSTAKRVLKNIDCTIYGGEKIGIVGRTGAGKSSIIAALFRLTEPTGMIKIDGIDVQKIGLNDLRRAISIIPQDPVVFTGSVRYNLDPFGEFQDAELWEALDQVQLKDHVANYTEKLDARLSESGGNLSVGQRQLICLARAILRKNKILIMDEATANVDHQTDGLIQNIIRSKFAACTVLTIAHRLNTIIDCDRVLVLDAGEILEFDSPFQLLKRHAIFYDMCKKTGPSMFAHLQQLAKVTHKARLQAKLTSNENH